MTRLIKSESLSIFDQTNKEKWFCRPLILIFLWLKVVQQASLFSHNTQVPSLVDYAHTLESLFSKIHFNFILPSVSWSPIWFLPLMYFHSNCVCFFVLSHAIPSYLIYCYQHCSIKRTNCEAILYVIFSTFLLVHLFYVWIFNSEHEAHLFVKKGKGVPRQAEVAQWIPVG
jgi:hypothetical protein